MRFRASGKVSADIPPGVTALGAALHGDRIEAVVTLPWILRGGLRWVHPSVELELAATYEAWSMLREIRIQPQGIAVQLGDRTFPLPDIVLRKDLRAIA